MSGPAPGKPAPKIGLARAAYRLVRPLRWVHTQE